MPVNFLPNVYTLSSTYLLGIKTQAIDTTANTNRFLISGWLGSLIKQSNITNINAPRIDKRAMMDSLKKVFMVVFVCCGKDKGFFIISKFIPRFFLFFL